MMAGRAAEGEGGPLTGQHDIEGGERGLRGPIGSGPGAFGDRRAGVIAVLAETGIDPLQVERPAANHGPGVAGRVAGAPGGLPVRVGALQEIDIIPAVNATRSEEHTSELKALMSTSYAGLH